MADLQLRVMGEDAASSAFTSMASAVRSASQVLIDFTRQGVRAYAESERSQRQLELQAKNLTAAFVAQSEVLSRANAVSGELVQSVQTMLLRYGAAPKDIEATTQAVLDFAAATGTDAKAAAEALTRGVETGSGAVKALGINFTASKDRAEDLRRATEALAEKFGGAGAEDAGSFGGALRGLEEAFGDVQKAWGGFVVDIAQRTGVLDALTEAFSKVARGAEITRRFFDAGGFDAVVGTGKALLFGGEGDVSAAKVALNRSLAQAALNEGMAPARDALQRSQLARSGRGGGRVRGGGGGADSRPMLGPDAPDFDFFSAVEGPAAPSGEQWAQMQAAAMEARAQEFTSYGDAFKKTNDDLTSMLRAASTSVDAALADMRSKQSQFAAAGQALGGAFASSLSQAVESLAAGEELDMGETVASILSSILPIIGTIAGTALGGPMGGTIGGGLGQLFGAGVRGAARNVTVNTMDAQSAREFFERDGGRALYDASRTGRGFSGRR